MTYQRVIPRDLFNEANLLKCYARLAILLDETTGHQAQLHHSGGAFEAQQDSSDGSLTLWPSVELWLGTMDHSTRQAINLWRPLNARGPWPLYARPVGEHDEVAVFDDHGFLTDEFKRLIGAL